MVTAIVIIAGIALLGGSAQNRARRVGESHGDSECGWD